MYPPYWQDVSTVTKPSPNAWSLTLPEKVASKRAPPFNPSNTYIQMGH